MVKLLLDAGVNIDTMDTNEVSYPGFIWGGGGGGGGKGGLARISSPLGNCEHCMKCDIRLVMPPPPPPPPNFFNHQVSPPLDKFSK